MDFVKIEKKNEGKYITRYDVTYRTKENKLKAYEMISRFKDLDSFEGLHDGPTDAVIIICHDENNEKILLCKEYRMAVGEWVVNFPAGLIDPGETPEIAAERELFEETGLNLDKITGELPESYCAVGFANEKNICIIGTASGEFKESTSADEEIEPAWYTKEDVLKLINEIRFEARTQAYCYMWATNA